MFRRSIMKSLSRAAAIAAGVLVAAGGGFALGRVSPHPAASGNTPVIAALPLSADPIDGATGAPAAAALPDFRDVAKRVIPCVVTIRSQRTVRVGGARAFEDDVLSQFFGRTPRGAPREEVYRQSGLGSGVIVSADGYILTNNHVVEQVDSVEAVTGDGKAYPARIIGTDPQTDLAVLRVDATGLRAVEMGDSDGLEVGEWVLAVGNPFSEALAHTVTAGIVSAKGRSNLNLADYEDFIQTDAAINPGNSGGALVDTRGRLVGINAAITTGSGSSAGVGFAIPINMARNVMDQLIKNGKVVRGWMGMTIQDLTPDLAEGMGLNGREGALVIDVKPAAPAAEAGLRRGDVITAVNGHVVGSNAELRNRISATEPGTKVSLAVIRDGKDRIVDATLGALPGSATRRGAVPGGGEEEKAIGLSVRPLTPDLARRLGYEDEEGVIIAAVEAGSAADEAGLLEGDLIKEANRRPVTSVAEYREAIAGDRKSVV